MPTDREKREISKKAMAKIREEKQMIIKLKEQGLCLYEGDTIPVMEAKKRGGLKGGSKGAPHGHKGGPDGYKGAIHGSKGGKRKRWKFWVYGVMGKKMGSKAMNLGYWVRMMVRLGGRALQPYE